MMRNSVISGPTLETYLWLLGQLVTIFGRQKTILPNWVLMLFDTLESGIIAPPPPTYFKAVGEGRGSTFYTTFRDDFLIHLLIYLFIM